MRLIIKSLGAILSAFALLGCLFSVHSLIDPHEAQLSNDADPFRVPPSAGESWLHLLAWLAVLGIGLWLFWSLRKP